VADEIRQHGRAATAIAVDVSVPEQVAACFDTVGRAHGRIDILVNNAGVVAIAPLADLSLEQWRRTIDTDLTGRS